MPNPTDQPDPTHIEIVADVLIAGGGLAGMTMALAVAHAGLRAVVVERQASSVLKSSTFDGRTSAISYGSARIFEGIGVWPAMVDVAEPILDIRVADGNLSEGVSPLFLHYDHRELLPDAVITPDAPFGYILENRAIRTALADAAEQSSGVELLAPAVLSSVERTPFGVLGELVDGRRVKAALAIGADGRNSAQRQSAGIAVTDFRYPQTSIVCTVAHEQPHNGVAVELFLPGGPFAMLPLPGQRTNIVWSEKTELVDSIMALDDAAFLEEVSRRFGDWLGELTLAGPRFAYPLGLLHAERYTDRRLALIGDAAHAIHPIAGQGFNMGLRDIAALAEAVVDAHRLGLDIGDAAVLARYERWRRFDNTLLATVTDGLTRLFSNDVAPVRLARDIGLAGVGKILPLKQLFMRHAMGVVGTLPRLVKGDPL
ncbi:MAG: UbiH/UbiF/VisC/COQ6 family ubiquinone biosynthesis hydroxylase [Rhodospirillaceae bacterium]|jgi:2-octaprenyl-6-methoxyphenol hydroxylase|nr:UbiH/UbiF/VisC/COQ6 family ubiquinone biosynthesis hydroxylase [Rhodospirillaceae bacterium]MBT5666055.1 UbiH/UbiF/VisC/COQ6 family ubiquinone biosynthesis hydroxylase [Rhodospirillaceae bacterium]MBT5809842.1 UbiH/UbiF/VisC/COQ6 family ubiquinone biosynthesis hydroxylase [Rhodospirillaceae bacterium]